MSDKEDRPKLDINKSPVSARKAKKLLYLSEFLSKQESRINSKKVSKILKKSVHEHTEDEKATLAKHEDIVKRISKNKEKRKLHQQRVLETEDKEDVLKSKCEKLAKILQQSKKTVIYTGAGISTAASIPDYRGPQGVWTLLQKGEQLKPQDLSDAEPTLTHMCITELHQQGHVKHVVSQNCDGLHIRSGLPRHVLSEVHGNMFIEICHNCRPHREYVRLFDVTENTGVRRHFTGRHCQKCGGKLKDTIVHFGEKGGTKSPYRWKEAVRAVNKCDLILCLGSSLKILKKYACLWCMDRVKHKRPKLVIVNLQWTPKDESATVKINGRCDDVMKRVMQILGYSIPQYSRADDPIFSLATCLADDELDTTTKKILEIPNFVPKLRSHGISRTPTPSDSSNSRSSVLSSTDSYDTEDQSTSQHEQISAPANTSNFTHENKHELKHFGNPLNSKEFCLSRSELICNEAKIAMQQKLLTAKISEINATCPLILAGNSKANQEDIDGYMNGTRPAGQGLSIKVEDQPDIKYDPLQGGPFDPGPASYEEKIMYLQLLQSQLEDLKRKQRLLKEQEHEHMKMQRKNQAVASCLKPKQTVGSPVSGELCVKTEAKYKISPRKLDANVNCDLDVKVDKAVKLDTGLKCDASKELDSVKKTVGPKKASDDLNLTKIMSPVKKVYQTVTSVQKSSNPVSVLQPGILKSKNGKIVQSLSSVSLISNSVQPRNIVQTDSNGLITGSESIDLSELNLKHKQCIADQVKLKNVLSALTKDHETVEEQMKYQHQNEHLRLHQHFLIRQQMNGSKSKKDEIFREFLCQQQILLAQQNQQLNFLRQNYLVEKMKTKGMLEALQKSQFEIEAATQNYLMEKLKTKDMIEALQKPQFEIEAARKKEEQRIIVVKSKRQANYQSKASLDNKSSVCSKITVDVSLAQNCAASLALKSPPERSPINTDHSIFSILHGKSPPGVQKSPQKVGQSKQLNLSPTDKGRKLMTCEACKFLNDYGMSKRRCVKCDELNVKHYSGENTGNLSDKPKCVAKEQNISMSSTCVNIESGCYNKPMESLLVVTDSCNSLIDQEFPGYNYVLDLEDTDFKPLVEQNCNSSIGGAKKSNTETYLTEPCQKIENHEETEQNIAQTFVQDLNINSDPSCDLKKDEILIKIPTSTYSQVGDPNSCELSPVIPYSTKVTDSTCSLTSVKENASVSCLSKSKIGKPDSLKKSTERVSFYLNDEYSLPNENSEDLIDIDIKNNESNENESKHKVGCKAKRSHSQSEIYDKQIENEEKKTAKQRSIRCRSHSDIDGTGDDSNSMESVESRDRETVDKGDNSSEDNVKVGKKRKLNRCLSVPGWFGKGLNIKKRRRY